MDRHLGASALLDHLMYDDALVLVGVFGVSPSPARTPPDEEPWAGNGAPLRGDSGHADPPPARASGRTA